MSIQISTTFTEKNMETPNNLELEIALVTVQTAG